eukprot:TRINITY_DN18792_c0_g1_i4.p1 TRINITY_DN18792_c0_g1~~TRINITY_DN18792_c0_g1_i4.p1  ORF type:complete len:279 (+),score=63.88 TRINITY_DN18792_c0_g1_i4:94-930(+)
MEAILQLDLVLDDDKLTPISAHQMDPERVARLTDVCPELTPENAVSVVCTTTSGETIETVVNSESMEHMIYEDPIMCTELSIAMLVEAQFEPDGVWTVSRSCEEQLNAEKATQFKRYSEMISKDEPDCLRTLQALLRAQPITRLYTGGGMPPHVQSHEGFGLRMPPDQIKEWQALNEKGQLHDIPRQAHALRHWDAANQCYTPVDATMDGAPATPEAADEWYVNLIKKLKASPYLGAELIDALITSEKYDYDRETERPCNFSGSFSNRWTEIAVNTTI